MRILLTGAFGNIGAHTLPQLLADGHTVRCFDVVSATNRRLAARWRDQVEVVWGDLRYPADVAAAVQGQDLVIHLAFVVPRLSVTGVNSEERPDWARAVNVGGTMNLLSAMQACPQPPRLIFASSLHVYGRDLDEVNVFDQVSGKVSPMRIKYYSPVCGEQPFVI